MTRRVCLTVLTCMLILGARARAQESGTSTNFDFVPGERVLFAEDFAKDRVGTFPQRLRLVVGNMEIIETGGRRFLRSTSDPTSIRIVLPEVLRKRFTIEFDVHAPHLGVTVSGDTKELSEQNWGDACATSAWEEVPTAILCFSNASASIQGGGAKSSVKEQPHDTTFRARIHVDGDYVKAYVNEDRVVNFPSATFARSKTIQINLPAHSDLKLKVEGHTDNTGVVAANQALSEKRAQAIVARLVSSGVEASRLSGRGMGATVPAAPNDTPEGRQQNRRVVLVKM